MELDECLQLLIEHLFPEAPETAPLMLQHAKKVLSGAQNLQSQRSDVSYQEMIDQLGDEKIAKFQELWSKLLSKKCIRNHDALLRFLMHVAQHGSSSTRSNKSVGAYGDQCSSSGKQDLFYASSNTSNFSSVANGHSQASSLGHSRRQRPKSYSFLSDTSSKGLGCSKVSNFSQRRNEDTALDLLRSCSTSRLFTTPSSVNRLHSSKSFAEPARNHMADPNSVLKQLPGTLSKFNPTSISDCRLCRDALYLLQGIDGKYLKWNVERSSVVFDDTVSISPPLKDLICKISECGWCFMQVRRFSESLYPCELESSGLFAQSFRSAISDELSSYFKTLALIQDQLGLMENVDGARLRVEDAHSGVSLRHLFVSIYDARDRLILLNSLIELCKSERGCRLLDACYRYSQHGDPNVQQVVSRILEHVCQPLHVFLFRWLFDGYLEDPFGEFFIASDTSVAEDLLWSNKYRIVEDMIPSFLTLDQAKKILLTGKSINFLWHKCRQRPTGDSLSGKADTLRCRDVSCLYDWRKAALLDEIIDASYHDASQRVIKLMNEKFLLQDHFQALKKYMLLTQGDFARHLMHLLYDDLTSEVECVSVHKFSAHLDAAIRQTNAQFEAKEIISRIGIAMSTAWDRFTLVYDVKGPINTVFTIQVMEDYSKLFKFVWRIKRLDFVLGRIWCTQMAHSRQLLKVIPELRDIFQSVHLFICEVRHFVQQIQYFFIFEVVECSWAEFAAKLANAPDLDFVITAHDFYLDVLIKRTLLDKSHGELLQYVRSVFDLIFKFDTCYQSDLQDWLGEEKMRSSTDTEVLTSELHRRKVFVEDQLTVTRPKFRAIQEQYRTTLRNLLVAISRQTDDQLMLLGTRLDFSGFYKSIEPLLETSFSFRQQYHRYNSQN